MSKRSREYFESFKEHQRLCEKYGIGSPPPFKKFRPNDIPCIKNSKSTKLKKSGSAVSKKKLKISIKTKKTLKIHLNKFSRYQYKKIATETIEIIKNGGYKANNGDFIKISKCHQYSFENTILYHHNDKYKFCDLKTNKLFNKMEIEIINETTLNGCYDFFKDGNISNPVALNFASARNAGGTFKSGSNAQEESLSRSSSLYGTLIKYKKEFYQYHKNMKSMLNSDSIIYSPQIPIFRDHNNNLLDNYYLCSFISSPAVHCKEFMKRNKTNYNKSKKIVYDTMKYRIDKILDIAVKHKHDGIILGSFGCGVFGNDINSISDIFAMLLSTKYAFCFKKVRFSCLQIDEYSYGVQAFEAAMRKWFKMK